MQKKPFYFYPTNGLPWNQRNQIMYMPGATEDTHYRLSLLTILSNAYWLLTVRISISYGSLADQPSCRLHITVSNIHKVPENEKTNLSYGNLSNSTLFISKFAKESKKSILASTLGKPTHILFCFCYKITFKVLNFNIK